MSNSSSEMQSWRIFHYARKHLSRGVLYAIFGRKNARVIDYWCEDPRYTSKPEKAYDPILGVKQLLDLLDDHGHCGVVRSTISYLAAGTSCEIDGDQHEIIEPLPNVSDEILADFRAVAALQRAIESGEAIEAIEQCKHSAIAEIERTVARYRKDLPCSEE